jgi:RAB protein geranylgeranyltransferase component A
MDEDGFEAHYDVVLSGTGLAQSVLSAALSKSGRRVLHLDRHDYYGGDYHATHSLTQFLELCARRKKGVDGGEKVEEKRDERGSEGVEKVEEEVSVAELCSAFEKRGE